MDSEIEKSRFRAAGARGPESISPTDRVAVPHSPRPAPQHTEKEDQKPRTYKTGSRYGARRDRRYRAGRGRRMICQSAAEI